jgi:hypothetical protein
MIVTRTEIYAHRNVEEFDQVAANIAVMEDAGWAVRLLTVHTYRTIVVFEREKS